MIPPYLENIVALDRYKRDSTGHEHDEATGQFGSGNAELPKQKTHAEHKSDRQKARHKWAEEASGNAHESSAHAHTTNKKHDHLSAAHFHDRAAGLHEHAGNKEAAEGHRQAAKAHDHFANMKK
jgi:hypothetical protein